jgi:tryptophanyl-tRNA synthetase
MSLKEPQLKMSKSHADPKSRILITDTKEDIHTKIKEALTDSEPGITYDPKTRPGVSNLLEILKHTTQSPSSCEELAHDLSGLTMRQLKEHVSQAVVKCLSGIRESYLELMLPTNKTIAMARGAGRLKAAARAGRTMKTVREHVGLQDAQWPSRKGEQVYLAPRRNLFRKYVTSVDKAKQRRQEAEVEVEAKAKVKEEGAAISRSP